ALQDGPLACVGQANGPLSVSGRFAGCVGDSRPVYSRYLLKSAVYGDFYLRKSAELGRCYFPIRALALVKPLASDNFIASKG
ncbi:hypothetical protein, partial [uncultured Senegalimassilia sp.]|uniref:hypothetical protein n=1 Tax=uncultured Senegalimassilia sp. TaxID=1714350 RepID=UPI0027DDDF11